MTGWLGLDQSKNRSGWAFWKQGLDLPVFGHFKLGDEYTPPGKVFGKLHMELAKLQQVLGFDQLLYEKPADPTHIKKTRNNNFSTPFLLIGIAAHVDSFCAATGIRYDWVGAASWRSGFIGSMPRGTERATLKDLVEKRCRSLGMKIRNDDEADACGILDYDLNMSGITPPWHGPATLPLLRSAAA